MPLAVTKLDSGIFSSSVLLNIRRNYDGEIGRIHRQSEKIECPPNEHNFVPLFR